MEIINYTGTGFSANQRRKTSHFADSALISPEKRTMRESALYFKGSVIHFFKVLNRFLWLVPAVACCAFVPSFMVNLISRHNSFAKMVSFENTTGISQTQRVFVDTAMSNLVLTKNPLFDSEGNLLEANFSSPNFKEPVTFQNYTVKSGDTISGISLAFGLSNISTLIAVNKIENVRSLSTGKKLIIPSMDGLLHSVESGETLDGIAEKYSVSVEDLLDVNDLLTTDVKVGDSLFIPGAKMDKDTLLKAMGEVFSYPITASWRLTSRFGTRKDPFDGHISSHTGIDMACPKGTPIHVALTGTVAFTGFSNIYGNYVIVKHHDGYQTLYAHMSQIKTKKGSYVSQGDVIGLVGSTGYSTGPHLHFTVYKNGKLVDPLTVLK